jgi:hypothetical protein
MTQRSTYSIHAFNDHAVLKTTDGSHIQTTDSMRMVAEALSSTADLIDQKRGVDASYTVDRFKHESAMTYVDDLLQISEMQWFFEPQDIREASSLGYPMVYFAESQTDYKDTIKIGYTSQSVESRMRQVKSTFVMSASPTPIAVVQYQSSRSDAVQTCHALEYWLHIIFDEHKVISEWFKAAPVLWFIYHYKHLSYERGILNGSSHSVQEVF